MLRLTALLDRRCQLINALVFDCDGLHDRCLPLLVVLSQRQKRFQFFLSAQNPFAVGFVDDQYIAYFHNAGLHRLHIVSHSGHQYDDANVGCLDDFSFILADPDRFDDDLLVTGGVENRHRIDSRARQPAEVSARGHRTNEDAFIQ